jgi:cyclophilin family peptidyl-prolyl cis-trans isomerase
MPTECPAADGSSAKRQRFDGRPPMCIDPTHTYGATMVTSHGTMTISLDAGAAPNTVNNFVFLSRYHYYDGVGFHRIIPGFMLQGGDPEGTGRGGPGYKFADEFHPTLKHTKPGILSMANAGPNSNGSQFFITVAATPWLDNKHSVFGEVTEGYDVVERISKVARGGGDRPVKEIRINSVKIERP